MLALVLIGHSQRRQLASTIPSFCSLSPFSILLESGWNKRKSHSILLYHVYRELADDLQSNLTLKFLLCRWMYILVETVACYGKYSKRYQCIATVSVSKNRIHRHDFSIVNYTELQLHEI